VVGKYRATVHFRDNALFIITRTILPGRSSNNILG
jgi:hypothetical protein